MGAKIALSGRCNIGWFVSVTQNSIYVSPLLRGIFIIGVFCSFRQFIIILAVIELFIGLGRSGKSKTFYMAFGNRSLSSALNSCIFFGQISLSPISMRLRFNFLTTASRFSCPLAPPASISYINPHFFPILDMTNVPFHSVPSGPSLYQTSL